MEEGLKIAIFQYTDRFGAVQNAFMTWSGADINYGTPGSIRFAVFENETEYSLGNRKETFVLPITAEDILQMFTRQGVVALEISNASWQLALERPFITVREFVDGAPQFVQKSLTDLNAQIIDVGIPESFMEAFANNAQNAD